MKRSVATKRPRLVSDHIITVRTDFAKLLRVGLVKPNIACVDIRYDVNGATICIPDQKASLDIDGYIVFNSIKFATCDDFVYKVLGPQPVNYRADGRTMVFYGEHSHEEWNQRINWRVNMDSLQARLYATEVCSIAPVLTFEKWVKGLVFPMLDARFHPEYTYHIGRRSTECVYYVVNDWVLRLLCCAGIRHLDVTGEKERSKRLPKGKHQYCIFKLYEDQLERIIELVGVDNFHMHKYYLRSHYTNKHSVLAPLQNPEHYPILPTLQEIISSPTLPEYHSVHLSIATPPINKHQVPHYQMPKRIRKYLEIKWWPYLYPQEDFAEVCVKFYYVNCDAIVR